MSNIFVDSIIPWLQLPTWLLTGNIYRSPIRLLSRKLLPVLDLPTIVMAEYRSSYGSELRNYKADGYIRYPFVG